MTDKPDITALLGDGGEEKDRRRVIAGKLNPSGKRDEHQRERDLVEISTRYLHGNSQQEIAAWLNEHRDYTLTQQQISVDIKLIHERWKQVYLINFEEAKAKELAHIEELEKAYWLGWERSMKAKEEQKSMSINDASGNPQTAKGNLTPTYQRTKTELKRTERDGSAEFLAGVQWCIEQRCKILGLNAPQKYEIDWRKEAEAAGVNPGDAFNAIVGKYLEDHEEPSPLGGRDDEGRLEGSSTDQED